MASVKGLTERELQLIAMSFACFDNQPKVNYKKLMDLSGLGTVASCTTCYCNAKKKLLALYAAGDGGTAAAAAPGANTSGKGKKRAAPAAGSKAGTSAKSAATNKRGRGGKAAAATTEAYNDTGEDDDEGNGQENSKKLKIERQPENGADHDMEANFKDEPAGENVNSSFIDEMLAELTGAAYSDDA